MTEFVLVSIGGFFGAICRYAISRKVNEKGNGRFPAGTLTVNLLGAFLLGILLGAKITGPMYILLGTGFMGAFTTFSTFKLESEKLRLSGLRKYLSIYLVSTYIGGFLLAFFGIIIGKSL
nr:CrcB family protein [Neobacillus sp. Marseille-Q6967]